jgi:exopolyphosphatase / guanosine-5'-triphosphate,3'-diphosphate pyrophosphatase
MPTFAAVDIGANSVRLKIARIKRGRLVLLAEDREVTRLGESVFRSGLLDPQAMAATVKVLQRFHKTAQRYGAINVRVVATSSLRDAQNASAFIQWVKATTGWRVEVITGVEEGRLIHLGVVSNARISADRLLLIDLGGGSCELTISEKQHIRDIVSLPLGAVRLTKEFLKHDPPKKKELGQLRAFIAEEVGRIEHRMRNVRVQVTVATSGTAAALAELWAAQHRGPTVKVPRAALGKLAEKLSKASLEQRRAMKGIGPRRAEIIIAGAAVYSELLNRLGLTSFRYLPLGLRDGVLAQMMSEFDTGTFPGRQVEAERESALEQMQRRYNVDTKFADRVCGTAVQLFQRLKAVHGLPPQYETLISAAAKLHEVGSYINRAGRHRHAHYLISHSEIFGFSTQQRAIIAAIARYVGNSRPRVEHRVIRILPELDRYYVSRAVAILRLARALDQSRTGVVTKFSVRVAESSVKISIHPKRGAGELESWAVEKESSYFRALFGRDLEISLA